MNDRDIDRMITEARTLAARLDAEGARADAALIRRLARSRAAAREANRRLYQDNRALQEACARAGIPTER